MGLVEKMSVVPTLPRIAERRLSALDSLLVSCAVYCVARIHPIRYFRASASCSMKFSWGKLWHSSI